MRTWEVLSIANSAYRLGQAYRDGNIYRHVNKYTFKYAATNCLPDYVTQLPFETHVWLEKIAKHAFRAGLNSQKVGA